MIVNARTETPVSATDTEKTTVMEQTQIAEETKEENTEEEAVILVAFVTSSVALATNIDIN